MLSRGEREKALFACTYYVSSEDLSANIVCRDDPRRNTELTNEQIKEFIMTKLGGKKKRRALKWIEKRIEKGISGADAEDDDDEE